MTIKNVVKNAKTAIAGGIKLDTLPEVVKLKPDLIIVGGGIANQDDKAAAAAKMKQMIQHAGSSASFLRLPQLYHLDLQYRPQQ